MSRFLLLGDILSLSEAKGTKTRFLGRLKVAAFADVIHARIKSESEYKWKKISRFQNRNSFSLLSLSEKKKERRNSLSLFPLSLSLRLKFSLFRPKKVRFERTNREREREGMICARRFVSLFKKCFSLVVGGVGFLKKKVTNFSFEQSR